MTKYFLAFLFALIAPAAFAADVTVTVPNVESTEGVVRVFICSEKEFLGNTCKYKKASRAMEGKMTFTIKNVPNGTYAIEIYQDSNENGQIDFGFLGLIPEEGYGFSKLGRIYSEPKFAEAAIQVDKPKVAFEIAMNY